MKSWTWKDWLIIAGFAGLVMLFYWPLLTPNPADRHSFPPGDFHLQFWAFSTLEARELAAGRLPLWNPYTFAGAPFWADVQAAVFYPPSLLTLLLSAPWGFSLFALEIEALAHMWLAATFTYLYARYLTANRGAAVIAAVTFTFSGYLTGYPTQQLAILEAAVWLPLILLCLHKTTESKDFDNKDARHFESAGHLKLRVSPSWRWAMLAGVFLGLALLAGHPQTAFIMVVVSTIYLGFVNYSPPSSLPPSGGDSSLPPAGGGSGPGAIFRMVIKHTTIFWLTGLGLAAIQFVPATEYTLLSVRAAGTYDAMAGGFPLTDVVQLLLPGQVSFYSPLYVGVVGLILAAWIPFTRPHRMIAFWGVTAAVAFVITLGGNTFLYSGLYLFVPGFSMFRGQERWAFVVAFGLAMLAGYGFKHVLESKVVPRHLTRGLFLAMLAMTWLSFYGLNDTGWTPDSPFYGLLGVSSLVTLLLGLAWGVWAVRGQMSAAAFTGLVTLLICFDLFTFNWQTNLYPQPPEWHTQVPAVVAAIQADAAGPDAPYRVYNEYRLYGNYGIPYQIEDLWGSSPLWPARYDDLLAPPMPIERPWELLNVKYVITWRETLFVPSTVIYQAPAADGTTYVHRLEAVGPRAWLVYDAEIADDATTLHRIAEADFDRWHIALVAPDAAPYVANLGGEGESQPITPTIHHAGHLSYHVQTTAPALLITSEIDYPGWRATRNGDAVPILRAYYTLRAVPLPAGTHTIDMRFRPLSVTVGAIISALTLGLVVVASLWRQPR